MSKHVVEFNIQEVDEKNQKIIDFPVFARIECEPSQLSKNVSEKKKLVRVKYPKSVVKVLKVEEVVSI